MARGRGYRVTLPAVLAALSLVLLYLAAIAPSGRWGLVAAAGIPVAAAVVSAGLGAGAMTYLAAGLLALLLLPDKSWAFLYLIFFGVYPLAKCLIERIGKLPLELLCKLVFFNAVLAVLAFGFSALLYAAGPEALGTQYWAYCIAGNIAFAVYDFGFTKLIALYRIRIDAVLRKRTG